MNKYGCTPVRLHLTKIGSFSECTHASLPSPVSGRFQSALSTESQLWACCPPCTWLPGVHRTQCKVLVYLLPLILFQPVPLSTELYCQASHLCHGISHLHTTCLSVDKVPPPPLLIWFLKPCLGFFFPLGSLSHLSLVCPWCASCTSFSLFYFLVFMTLYYTFYLVHSH